MKTLNNTLNEKYFNTFVLIFGYWEFPLRLHPRLRPHLRLCSENVEVVWKLTNSKSHSLVEAIVNNIDLYETIGEVGWKI